MRGQKVCVLGAGIVGVTAAWMLSRKGCEVTVIEREAEAARGTSFANGAQISVANAMPWSNPDMPRHLMAALIRRDRGVFVKPRWSRRQWQWGIAFLRNCRLRQTRHNLEKAVAICARSRQLYRELIAREPLEFDCANSGTLSFCSDRKEHNRSRNNQLSWARCLGEYRREVSPAQILSIEPALEPVKDTLVGGFYAREDMTGDARRFSVALAQRCVERGVAFCYRTEALQIQPDDKGAAVITDADRLRFDHIVCCLGVESDRLLAPLGIDSGIYPVKGYSITIELSDEASKQAAPTVSLSDARHKIVVSRLGDRLRVAGIAEIGDTAADVRAHRIDLLTKRTRALFPAVSLREFSPWAGLRPMTPSNLPRAERSRHPRVWLNCGHGALGWTAAMATAEMIACDIIKN